MRFLELGEERLVLAKAALSPLTQHHAYKVAQTVTCPYVFVKQLLAPEDHKVSRLGAWRRGQ